MWLRLTLQQNPAPRRSFDESMLRLCARNGARQRTAGLHAAAAAVTAMGGGGLVSWTAPAAPSGDSFAFRSLHSSLSLHARKKATPASGQTTNPSSAATAEAAAASTVPPPRRTRKPRSAASAVAASDSPVATAPAVAPPALAPAPAPVPAPLPDFILGLDVNTRSIGWVVVRVAGGPAHEASGWIDLAKIAGLHAKAEEVERKLGEIKQHISSKYTAANDTNAATAVAAANAAPSSVAGASVSPTAPPAAAPVFLVVIESYLRMLSGSATFQLKHLFTLAELHALTCWLCYRTLNQPRIEHVHPTSPRAFFGIKKPPQPRSIEEEAIWRARGGSANGSSWDPTLMEQENAAAAATAAEAEEDAEFIAEVAAADADAEADAAAVASAADLDENGLPVTPPKPLSAKLTKQALALSLSIKSSVFAFLTTPQWAATPEQPAEAAAATSTAVATGESRSSVATRALDGASSLSVVPASAFAASLASSFPSPSTVSSPSAPSPSSFFPPSYPWRYLGLKRVKAVKAPKIKKVRVSKKQKKKGSKTDEDSVLAVEPASPADPSADATAAVSASAVPAAAPAPVGRFCPTNFDVSDAALLALYQWHRLQLELQSQLQLLQEGSGAGGPGDLFAARWSSPILSAAVAASASASASSSSVRRFHVRAPVAAQSRAEREATREFFRERARSKRDAAAADKIKAAAILKAAAQRA